MEIWDGKTRRPIRDDEKYETERKPNKVLCPFSVKEGMTLFSVYQSEPFTIRNKWLVLKVDESNWLYPLAFCVLLYSHRYGTPGQTTKLLNLTNLPRDKWRMEV